MHRFWSRSDESDDLSAWRHVRGHPFRVGARKRTVWYVEETGGTRLRVAERSRCAQHDGWIRRCSREFMHNPGYPPKEPREIHGGKCGKHTLVPRDHFLSLLLIDRVSDPSRLEPGDGTDAAWANRRAAQERGATRASSTSDISAE